MGAGEAVGGEGIHVDGTVLLEVGMGVGIAYHAVQSGKHHMSEVMMMYWLLLDWLYHGNHLIVVIYHDWNL